MNFQEIKKIGDKYRKSLVPTGKNRVNAINDRSLNNLLPNVPLYCRQKIGDIIVMFKSSPVQNRLIDIVWCDKSSLDKGSKDLHFHLLGSLQTKNISGKSVLFYNMPAKFITLASKYDLGNGLNALTPILAALHNWGLETNNFVHYNPNRINEIKEQQEATEIYIKTDNPELKKHLADNYSIGKKEKFIPIWSEEIQNYFGLEFTPIKVEPHTLLKVKDLREIVKINQFKRTNPEAKNVAANPIARLTYSVTKSKTLDRIDNQENIQSTTKEISEAEYERLLKAEIKSNYRLARVQNELEASEIVLKDKRILRKVPKFESFVVGCKYKGEPIIKRKQVEFKYYLITERVINTWYY